MAVWIVMLIVNIAVLAAMAYFGWTMTKKVPEMEGKGGYRSERSLLDAKTWEYAQKRFGKLFMIVGAASFVVCLTTMLCIVKVHYGIVALVGSMLLLAQVLAVVLGAILPTELGLKKEFNV